MLRTLAFKGMALGAVISAAAGLALPALTRGPATLAAAEASNDHYQRQVLPLLERYCVECHSEDYSEAGIVLDRFEDQASAVKDGKTWIRVLEALEARAMPPADAQQPSLKEQDRLIGWIEKDFLAAQCGQNASPAPVVARRLNRREYDNTLRDLLGLDLHLADGFPPDEIGFGYDNVGSALNISPIHVEKYLDAAETALDAAIVVPDAGPFPPIELIGLRTYPLPRDKPVEFEHALKPGRYLVDFSLVRVGISESARPPRLVIGFGSDSRAVDAVRVQDETVVYRFWIKVAAGDKQVRVALAPGQAEKTDVANPAEVTANVSGDQRYGSDRGLHVDSMVVKGPVPLAMESLPQSHRSLLFRMPEHGDESRLECARAVIGRFAERAFRRPARPEEIEGTLAIFRLASDRGESFERAAQVALSSVLASPQFLFLVEPVGAAADRPLTEHELASRLSYFLWSSMPDGELFREAHAGTLRKNLRAQAARMLADPKSGQLVKNFTGQWLQLRKLDGAVRDGDLFPGFDDPLREAMREETEHCFTYVLRNNRSILELIDADYTFLNETLAKHYGISGVSGEAFRMASLPDRRRGGLLTQASVLTLTSNPNRTSPVKRGQWILQQLMGTPPPPPPPDVPKLDERPEAAEAATLRDRLEAHRANPDCASCHSQMDPLGFALENYDAIGRWRVRDGEFPVDPSGALPGGRKFVDATELKQLLRSDASSAKKFTKTLIKNMMIYALGRGLEPSDYCAIEEIRKRLDGDGHKIHHILLGIVESDAFQRAGASARPEPPASP